MSDYNYLNKQGITIPKKGFTSLNAAQTLLRPAHLTLAISLILMGYSTCADAETFAEYQQRTGVSEITCSGKSCTVSGNLIDSTAENLRVEAEGATLTITTGTVSFANATISAGQDEGNTDASSSLNTTIISGSSDGGITANKIYGSKIYGSNNATTYNNRLIINSGKVTAKELYAAYALVSTGNAHVSGNTLSIGGSADIEVSAADLYAGFAMAPVTASADKNTLIISSGVVKADVVRAGFANTESGDVGASGNTLTINGATLASNTKTRLDITAGESRQSSYQAFSVTNGSNNTLSITNTSIRNDNSLSTVYLRAADLSGFEIIGNSNSVFLDNVTFPGTGVRIQAAYVTGQADSSSFLTPIVSLSDNRIYLGSVYGTNDLTVSTAYLYRVHESMLTINNNALYVYGTSDLSNSKLYGVNFFDCANTAVQASGNTLFFGYNGTPWTSANNYSIGKVSGFNSITFNNAVFGKTISIADFAGAISSTGTYDGTTTVNASNIAFSATEPFGAGSSYKMLTVGNIQSGGIDLTSTSSTFTVGSAVEGNGKVSLEDNDGDGKNDTVVFTVSGSDPSSGGGGSGMRASEQTHSAAMAATAAALTLNQGADTTSSAAFNLSHSGMSGIQAFSSIGGGAARAKTGSHVTLNSLNLSVGVGSNIPTAYGTFSIGGAFEAGYGRFKNHFDADTAEPYIKKNGHVSYYGVALLGNMEFKNQWHAHAALRYGRMSSKVSNGLYDEGEKRNYNIDISSYYIGMELGGGKVIKLNDKDSLDLYGKYFFLYQHGDTFRTSAETYDLDAVTSRRLRLAGRYQHSFTPGTSLYAGFGLEREFDGKSKLKIKTIVGTFDGEPSKADGTRAFAEAGYRILPEGSKGFNLDLGVKGFYGGKYRGIWASADARYSF